MKDSETASVISSASVDSAVSDVDSDEFFDPGEVAILAATLEDASSVESVNSSNSKVLTSLMTLSSYGKPLPDEEASKVLPPGKDGLVWHATVIPDNYFHHGKLIRGLNRRDFLDDGTIKPRRPSLPLTMTDLFSSLTKIQGPEGPRYIFYGVLNGWPSLRTFELIELEKKRTIGPLTPPDYMHSSQLTWSYYWSAEKEGKGGISPAIKDTNKIYRAKLRGAPWTSHGW